MATLEQNTHPSEKANVVEAVTPIVQNFNHVDAAFDASKNFHRVNFQNVFPLVSHFIVHPEWISEAGIKRQSQIMNRPAWSWEQPKYRQNFKPRSADQAPPDDPKEEQFSAQPEPSDMPYKLHLLRHYTPWVKTAMPPAEGHYIKTMVTREEKPDCFARHDPEYARLKTTIQERERLQFHIHY